MDGKSEEIVNQIGTLFETIATSSVFFENIEISFAEMRTLLYIIKSNHCTMSDLINNFDIPASTATGIVDRLVKDDYVSRSRSEKDRRKVTLKETEKGLELHKQHRNVILKEMSNFLQSLSDEKKDRLLKTLQEVNSLITIHSLSKQK